MKICKLYNGNIGLVKCDCLRNFLAEKDQEEELQEYINNKYGVYLSISHNTTMYTEWIKILADKDFTTLNKIQEDIMYYCYNLFRKLTIDGSKSEYDIVIVKEDKDCLELDIKRLKRCHK